MNYRRRMRELREDHDLSQKDVGKILNKSQQGYSHIENGDAELKIEDAVTLSKLYEVSVDYFVGVTDDPKPSPPAKQSSDEKHDE